MFTSQPRGLYTLIFGEAFERFSYYGAQSLLVLYLSKIFLFSDSKSYAICGVYITFAFAMPVLGGMLADRFIGFRKAIIIGAVLLIVSNLLLMVNDPRFLYLALALNVCGIGLYKGNSTGLIGKLFQPHDPQIENSYTYFYLGMNIGATLGAILYGVMSSSLGYWHVGFAVSAFCIMITLATFILKMPTLIPVDLRINKSELLAYSLIVLTCIMATAAFVYHAWFGKFLMVIGVIILLSLFSMARKYARDERNRIIALLILFCFVLCFFATSAQVFSSISLFIERDVNRSLFGWEIPTLFFSSLYPLAVILMAPILIITFNQFAIKNQALTIFRKMQLGLLFAALGFIFFALAAFSSEHYPNSSYSLLWLIFGYFCLGAGELSLVPALFSTINLWSPKNLQGTMLGVYFLFVAFGGYLSSVVAKFSDQTHLLISSANPETYLTVYEHTFLSIGIATILITILLAALVPWIKTLIRPKQ